MFIVVLRSLGFEVICFAGIYNIQYVVLVFFFFFPIGRTTTHGNLPTWKKKMKSELLQTVNTLQDVVGSTPKSLYFLITSLKF